MATVSSIIKGAMRDIGATATGEAPSANESLDALETLNQMLDSWSAEGLMIFEEKQEEFNLTAGQQVYTFGSGGDFDSARPIQIKKVKAKQTDTNSETHVEIFNQQKWADIVVKSTDSNLPLAIWYNAAFPLGEVNVWPKPSAPVKLVIYSEKPLTVFANISDTIQLPPGFEKAIRKNLALELAPEYGAQPSSLLVQQAMDSKADIIRRNTKPVYMKSDAAGLTHQKSWNWITGE